MGSISNKTNAFFSKSRWGAFFNPFFLTRKELYKAIETHASSLQGRIVDLGCGTKPYRHLFAHAHEYIGMDIEISGNKDQKSFVDVYYNGKHFPFDNQSIDAVFSSETFEHIFNLDEVLSEIHRVLKKDGLLLATCPFTWPEHEVPYDYARYTSFAIKDKLTKLGFEIIDYRKSGNYITAVIQLQVLYIYFFTNKIPLLNHLLFVLLITPQFLVAWLLTRLLPRRMKRQDLYLNNIILAKKL